MYLSPNLTFLISLSIEIIDLHVLLNLLDGILIIDEYLDDTIKEHCTISDENLFFYRQCFKIYIVYLLFIFLTKDFIFSLYLFNYIIICYVLNVSYYKRILTHFLLPYDNSYIWIFLKSYTAFDNASLTIFFLHLGNNEIEVNILKYLYSQFV